MIGTKKVIAAAAALWCLCAACGDAPVRVFMAGDSTMADKPLYKTFTDSATQERYADENPERGWGQLLPARFEAAVEVHNHAMNGRSTRSFVAEGRWQRLVDSLRAGDYVVIQFGHNDQSRDKGDRYASPDDYAAYLRHFVADVRAKGATPVLCTPVVRRRFDGEGRFCDVHGAYPDSVRRVAAATGAALIDMHAGSRQLLEAAGEEGSKALFLHVAPGRYRSLPHGKEDNTHFNEAGAAAMAGLFVDSLRRTSLAGLKAHIKEPEPVAPHAAE